MFSRFWKDANTRETAPHSDLEQLQSEFFPPTQPDTGQDGKHPHSAEPEEPGSVVPCSQLTTRQNFAPMPSPDPGLVVSGSSS